MWRAVQLGPAFVFQQSPLFYALLLFTMLERLSSFASDVAIERDWLTQLVGEPNFGNICCSACRHTVVRPALLCKHPLPCKM